MINRAVFSSQVGIGGDFPIAIEDLFKEMADSNLFATGRDALGAIVKDSRSTEGHWLVPDFTCPVVPKTLVACGVCVQPYRWLTPWSADVRGLKQKLLGAAGIIVPFYMGLAPGEDIWKVLGESDLCVVEDRCQCVGPPPSSEQMLGSYAFGSYRKWLPVPDGGYCVKRVGPSPCPSATLNAGMATARLAASLIKHMRDHHPCQDFDDLLERAQVELFALGERLADPTKEERRATTIAERVRRTSYLDSIARRRIENQVWLSERLLKKKSVRILEPCAGAIRTGKTPVLAVPVLCSDRDGVRAELKSQRIFCAVHWSDADWSGGGGPAARLAHDVLSLPIDQRYSPDDLQRVIDVLA